MEKCISCLPNGTLSQHSYLQRLKQNGVKRIVYRLSEDGNWNFATVESFDIISRKQKKNKAFEWFSSDEYKE